MELKIFGVTSYYSPVISRSRLLRQRSHQRLWRWRTLVSFYPFQPSPNTWNAKVSINTVFYTNFYEDAFSDNVDDLDDDNDGILDIHDEDDDGDGIKDLEVKHQDVLQLIKIFWFVNNFKKTISYCNSWICFWNCLVDYVYLVLSSPLFTYLSIINFLARTLIGMAMTKSEGSICSNVVIKKIPAFYV